MMSAWRDRGLPRRMVAHRAILLLVGALCFAQVGLLQVVPQAAAADNQLIVGSWGGVWDETTQKYIIDPLVKETGAKISIVPGSSTEQYAKLMANQSNPPFDVLWIDLNVAAPAAAQSAFLPLTAADVPNLKDVYPAATYFDDQAVAGSVGGISIVYDSDQIPSVDSWQALWDDANACNVALSPIDAWGFHELVIASRMFGGTKGTPGAAPDLQPGFDAIKKLAPDVSILTADYDLRQVFERKEVALGVQYSGEAYVMYTSGLKNIRLAKPKEGMVAIPNLLVIPKNAKHPDLAKKFINQALGTESQLGFARAYASAPTNATVKVDPSLAEWMPYGDQEVEALITPDWTALLPVQDRLTEQWNKEIVPEVGKNC
jgi:putative spermidine/putrescine transport system substrate-binding protein